MRVILTLLILTIIAFASTTVAEESSIATAESAITQTQPSFLEQSATTTSDSDSEDESENEADSESEGESEAEVESDDTGLIESESARPARSHTQQVQSRIDAAKLHFKSSSLAQQTSFIQSKVDVQRRRRGGRKGKRGGKKGKRSTKRSAQDVEDCVACRYIWLQVEMDVGNSQLEENIYDSFTQNCIEAQKAPIFYPACQDMFDAVDDMIGDYMDGYTVNQVCENSRLCR